MILNVNILEQSSFQRYTTGWVFLALCHMSIGAQKGGLHGRIVKNADLWAKSRPKLVLVVTRLSAVERC